MAEEEQWRGGCRLVAEYFRALAKAFARQKAQARQDRKEDKPKTPVEFLVFTQLLDRV